MNKVVFAEYIKARLGIITAAISCYLIMFLISFVYAVPMMPTILSVAVTTVIGILVGAWDYRNYVKKHHQLVRALEAPELFAEQLEYTDEGSVEGRIGLIEEDYLKMLIKLTDDLNKSKELNSERYNSMVEYYTVWVHQIKTPIAAISLIVQNMEDRETANRLKAELTRVESYAEMALNYLRLGSESNDLRFEEVDVDSVVRGEIKKMMSMFFAKGLSVDFVPSDIRITTDKKWLGFIIGQFISNAIKYQTEGTIHFYGDENSFVIQDEGIGIAKEDIPRIFEKGYTGYNGHNEKQSSGLGLYLVKKAADMLNIKVAIESEPGTGTRAKVIFEKEKK